MQFAALHFANQRALKLTGMGRYSNSLYFFTSSAMNACDWVSCFGIWVPPLRECVIQDMGIPVKQFSVSVLVLLFNGFPICRNCLSNLILHICPAFRQSGISMFPGCPF